MKRIVVVLLVFAALGAGVYFAWDKFRPAPPVTLRTAEVKRTDLVAAISATGTVEPEEVVDVGAQVAGMILSFGLDAAGKPVDYGSVVDEGTVLARIDDSLYTSDTVQAQAQLTSAKASVTRAEADLGQMNAKLEQAKKDWERAQRLGPGDLISQSAIDAYEAAYGTAQANLAVGEATILQAKASVETAQAALGRAKRNLGYCVIASPVKGVIIDRRVNIGQTVVSSLNAPSLFLIAKDLKRMQVWVAVNEADISGVHAGQAVTFTVDAFAGRTFKGAVNKVRLNASMTQNVVTYTVEVTTDNSDLALLPYLTANVSFETARRENVLAVPNAAVRWTPTAEQVDPEFRSEFAAEPAAKGAGTERTGGGARGGGPSSPSAAVGRQGRAGGDGAPDAREAAPRGRGTGGGARAGRVWVQSGAFVRPVRVKTGLSDGTLTEVSGEGLTEGMVVVIGEERAASAAAPGTTNPFAPQIMRGGGRGGR